MIAVLVCLPAVILGWLIVRILSAGQLSSAGWLRWLAEIGLGFAVGAGLSSSLFFLLLYVNAATRATTLSIEICLIIVAALVLRRARARASATPFRETGPWIWVVRIAAGASVAVLIAGFVQATSAAPNGDFDAFALWNLRAKFLTAPDNAWRIAVSPELMTRRAGSSHPGYPLLLSAFVARGWTIAGSYAPEIPAAISLLFSLGAIASVAGLLAALRGELLGLLAALLILACDAFSAQAPSQYADIPLAVYIVGSIAILALALERDRNPAVLALSGLLAGFAPWTKDEGVPFLLLFLAVTAWQLRRRAVWLAAGAAGPALLTLLFKLGLAPAIDTTFPKTISEIVDKAGDAGRWLQILSSFGSSLWQLGPIWAHPLLLLALLLYFFNRRPANLWLGYTIAGLLAIEFAVYLVTTAELAWHLGTSNHRLLVQVWPAVVFVALLQRSRSSS